MGEQDYRAFCLPLGDRQFLLPTSSIARDIQLIDDIRFVLGNAYGHIAIGVEDIYGTCEQIRGKGGKVTREPGSMPHGSTVIAFVEDPNGYKIELIQR